MIEIRCNCGETYHSDEAHIGRRIQCLCGQYLEVKQPSVEHDKYRGESASTDEPSWYSTTSESPRSNVLTRRQKFLAIASLIGVLVVCFGAYKLGFLTKPVFVSPPSNVLYRPQTGTEVGGGKGIGPGVLKVINGTSYDAVVLLVAPPTDTPRRALFVRKGETGTLKSINDGVYLLRYQLGSEWLVDGRFNRPHKTTEFESTLDFFSHESVSGTTYNSYEITLHEVPYGNERSRQIPNSRFTLPPL